MNQNSNRILLSSSNIKNSQRSISKVMKKLSIAWREVKKFKISKNKSLKS